MSHLNFKRHWNVKCNEILKSSRMSTAQKLLAYKIFLRPILIYKWFEHNTDSLKKFEIQVLKKLLGASDERKLYKLYTDIDIKSYMKIERIRWERLTGSHVNNVRHLLSTVSNSTDDHGQYFTRATAIKTIRPKKRVKNNAQVEMPAPRSLRLRRSTRLAIKKSNSFIKLE